MSHERKTPPIKRYSASNGEQAPVPLSATARRARRELPAFRALHNDVP